MKAIVPICLLGLLVLTYACPSGFTPDKDANPDCADEMAERGHGRPLARHYPCLKNSDCSHGFQCCFTLPGGGCHSMCYNAAVGDGRNRG